MQSGGAGAGGVESPGGLAPEHKPSAPTSLPRFMTVLWCRTQALGSPQIFKSGEQSPGRMPVRDFSLILIHDLQGDLQFSFFHLCKSHNPGAGLRDDRIRTAGDRSWGKAFSLSLLGMTLVVVFCRWSLSGWLNFLLFLAYWEFLHSRNIYWALIMAQALF